MRRFTLISVFELFFSFVTVHPVSSCWDVSCSPPPRLLQLMEDSYTGLTAPTSASDPTTSTMIRVRVCTVAHILLTSAWSHKRAWQREREREGDRERCAECRLQCILLCSMHPASSPEALHWHRASHSIKPRFSFSSEARVRGDR